MLKSTVHSVVTTLSLTTPDVLHWPYMRRLIALSMSLKTRYFPLIQNIHRRLTLVMVVGLSNELLSRLN